MRGVWSKSTPQESDGHACTAHRRRPKPPPSQGVGALAASERNDRATTPERVPHRLPAAEVTKRGVTRKPAGSDFTHRAPTARPVAASIRVTASVQEPSHMLPQTHSVRRRPAQGIVKADGCYVGREPCKGKRDGLPSKRSCGTRNMPAIGAVERNAKGNAKPSESATSAAFGAFLLQRVHSASLLMTDEYRAYRQVAKTMHHSVVDHGMWYADGQTHTNTNEGFWGMAKRAGNGSHHHYTLVHAPKYICKARYKYNQRSNADAFGTFLLGCFA